jgi:hypothetical protein
MSRKPKEERDDPDKSAYRERAKTAVLIADECDWKEKIVEAVYWPKEGSYGIGTSCTSRDRAMDIARKTLTLGFGFNPSRNEVHIIETRTRVVKVSIAPKDTQQNPPASLQVDLAGSVSVDSGRGGEIPAREDPSEVTRAGATSTEREANGRPP